MWLAASYLGIIPAPALQTTPVQQVGHKHHRSAWVSPVFDDLLEQIVVHSCTRLRGALSDRFGT